MSYAEYCYEHFPTIVNNIPKEKNIYNNTLLDYAKIDNNLAAANMAIGESSNLAQLALTYSYNFSDEKYSDYVCILSVLAQAAIDNAKRKFDVDLNSEIARIKKDMDIENNKKPLFFVKILESNSKSRNTNKTKEEKLSVKEKYREMIDYDLTCPMNYLYTVKFEDKRSSQTTLPMKHFFVKHDLELGRRKSKAVEDLIQKYSLDLYNSRINQDDSNDYFLLRSDFEDLINDIKNIYVSKNYIGLMSWLIDRAFNITPAVKRNNKANSSNTNKNKSLLIKTLYDINKDSLLKCFSKNIENK